MVNPRDIAGERKKKKKKKVLLLLLLLSSSSSSSIIIIIIIIIVITSQDANDNDTERRNLRYLQIYLQSPHCAANCLQHVGSNDQGAIMCKSCRTHRPLFTCSVSCVMWYKDACSAIKFDRVGITFISALHHRLKPLADE